MTGDGERRGRTSEPSGRRAFFRRSAAAGVLGLDVLVAGGSCAAMTLREDALTRHTRDNLRVFTGWLARADARGFVGEFGWANDRYRGFGDGARWNLFARRWYG